MNENLLYLISFCCTFLSIFLILKFKIWKIYSHTLNSFDKINKEKIPTSFGIVFIFYSFLFLIFYIFLKDIKINDFGYYIFTIFTLFIIFGLIEDFFSIESTLKLLIIISFTISINLTYLNLLYLDEKIIFILSFFYLFILINSINFIDGSNGFLASFCLFFTLGIYIIDTFKFSSNLIFFNLLYFSIPPLIAFSYFNIKSKIFMGNVGSFYFGFLITLIVSFYLKQKILVYECLILTMYPFLDISISLFKKIIQNRNIFKKDFCFFFLQPIIRKKKSHLFVLKKFVLYNFSNLIALFIAVFYNGFLGFFLSFIFTLIIVYYYYNISFNK